ncbi:MAG TPA: hypothetical protein VHD62_02285 [Opitutaceae bacterium]|nr:hypothetical protein [Opitutaceae bacterium]
MVAKLSWAWKCRAAYDRAVELDPNNAAYHWSRLGFFCVAPRVAGGGDEKAAAEAEAIRRLDAVAGRIAFATLYLAEKKFDLAFAQVDALARERPDDFFALYHVGRCAALSGQQLERGRAALEHCLALPAPPGEGMPTRAAVHYRLANILEKAGEAAAAQAEYAAARAEDPDFRPAKIALKG